MTVERRSKSNTIGTFSPDQARSFLRATRNQIALLVQERGFGPGGSYTLPTKGQRVRITTKGLAYVLAQRDGWSKTTADKAALDFEQEGRLPPYFPNEELGQTQSLADPHFAFTTGQVGDFLSLSPGKVAGLFDRGEFGPHGGFVLAKSKDRRILPEGLLHLLLKNGKDRVSAQADVAEFISFIRDTILLVAHFDERRTAVAQTLLQSLNHTLEIVSSSFEAGRRAAGPFPRSVAMISQDGKSLTVLKRLPQAPTRARWKDADPYQNFEVPLIYELPDDNPGASGRLA